MKKMKKLITEADFIQEFNRENTFSRKGLLALYDYFCDFEEATGEDVELDVIAICCEFSEYEDIEEFNDNYNTDYEDYEEIDETIVIPVYGDSFIIQDF